MPQMDLGNGWMADTDTGQAYNVGGGVDGGLAIRPLTADEMSSLTAYFNSPQYASGRATAQAQAAAHKGGLFGGGLGELLGIGAIGLGGLGLAGLGPLSGLLGGTAATDLGVGSIGGDIVASGGVDAGTGTMGVDFGVGAGSGTLGSGSVSSILNPGAVSDPYGLGVTGGGQPFLGDPSLGGIGQSTADLTQSSLLPGGQYSNMIAPGAGGVAGNPFGTIDMGGAGSVTGAPALGGIDNTGSTLLQQLQRLIGGSSSGGSPAGGNALTNQGGPSLGGLVGSTAPGLLALAYAAKQGNPSAPYLSDINNVLSQLQGNQNSVVKAATDPINQNIAAGYGNLVQSLGQRGVLGSSFGNTDIANFLAVNNNTLGNAGANALQGSLGLQGQLAGQGAGIANTAQANQNNLYGRAFDILGRGLNPQGYGGGGTGGGLGAYLSSLMGGP